MVIQFPQPSLDLVGCADHQAIADEIAERSITLVCDDINLLPLRSNHEKRVAVIVIKPIDLTPADISSYVTPGLGKALRQYHPNIDEFMFPYAPKPEEVTDLLERLGEYDMFVIGTLNAYASSGRADFSAGAWTSCRNGNRIKPGRMRENQ